MPAPAQTTPTPANDPAAILADPKNSEKFKELLSKFQNEVHETQQELRESVRVTELDLAVMINARD